MVASIYGPLSGSGTHYSSDIGITESPSRSNCTLSSCKRRLMFTQRIFQGEAIYLDLRTANGSRQRTNLETDLKALGAKVEGFLSKDVTHVVTDRTDVAAQPNSGAAGGLSSPVATGSRGGSLKTPKAVPAAFSRAQALLNRSVSRQQQQQKSNTAATDPVSLAKQWGIRVTSLQKVLHIIEREKAKCDPNRKLSSSKHGSPKGAVRVRKLEGAFIKVEDMSCQFRPSSKNFPSFPVIDVNDPAISHNQSPFNRRKPQATKAQDNHSSTVKGDVIVSKPVPVVKEKPCVQQQAEGTPSTKKPAVKQVPKTGFCEVCDTTYRNLKEHAKSNAHQKFALGTDNFNSLDCIISELPSLAQLQSDLSKLTISAEAESNEELEQDFTKDSLSEEKSDLNCGALTESEKGLKTPERLAPPIVQDVPMDTAESCSSDRSMVPVILQTITPVILQTMAPVISQTMAPVVSQTMAPVVSQTMAAVISQTMAPVVSQTMAPVVSQTMAPVVSQTMAPVVSQTMAPVVSQTMAPVVSQIMAPVISQTMAPVVSQTMVPVVSQTMAPVVSQTMAPVVSQTMAPVISQTMAPVVSQTMAPMISQTMAPVVSQTMAPVVSQTMAPVISQTMAPVVSQTMAPVVSQTMAPVILQRQSSNDISQTDPTDARSGTPTSSTVGYEQDSRPQEGSTAPYTCSMPPVFISHSNEVCHTTTTCTDNKPSSDCDKDTLNDESPMAIDNDDDIGNLSFNIQGCVVIEVENLKRSEELQENPASITSKSQQQKSAVSESQRCLETSQKSTSSEHIPGDSVQTPSVSQVEGNEDKDNVLDEVLLLTPYKVAHPMSDPTGMAESPRVMPTLTPQKTPLKDFTPVKCNSDMRVLSESAVQAVLKELTFLNNDAPMEFAGGGPGHAEQALVDDMSNHIDLSGDSRSGSDSFRSMPELRAEVSYNLPDAETNDATMPEPLSSRGSYFDVSPVKLITQFSFGCLEGPESSYDASSKSQPQFTAVKDRAVAENYSMDSHHSDALLPDSISDSKSFPTTFSNILSRISADSSQVKNSDQCTEVDNSNDVHSMVLDKTLTEDQSCEPTPVNYANHSMPALQVFEIPIATTYQETPAVELDISQDIPDEQMEFSDISSDRVENSIAQNLLARLQDQSFSGSEEEDAESAPDVLLHYNGGIQQQALGSDALAKAAKELINVDNVFCGESVVCDSRSTATMHAPLDNISQSPNDTCSSIIPVATISNIVCGDTNVTHANEQGPSAMVLPQQWMSALSAVITPATLTTHNQPVPVEQMCTVEIHTSDINQNNFFQTANPASGLQSAAHSNGEQQLMSCSQETTEYSSASLSSSNVNTFDDPTPAIEPEEPEGRWSPSMILNPVNLWWTNTNTSQDQNSAPAINVKLKTPVKMPPKCHSQSPSKAYKVLASKVQKKSKKSRSDKERVSHSSEKKHKKSSKSKDIQVEVIPETSHGLDTSVSICSEYVSHKKKKSKSHKHKSHKSKDRSPDSKSEKHRTKESKTKESTKGLSSGVKSERHRSKKSETKESTVGLRPDVKSERHKSKKSKTKESTKGLRPDVKSERHKSKKSKTKECTVGLSPDVKSETHKSKKDTTGLKSPLANLERYMSKNSKTTESTIGPNPGRESDKYKSKKSKIKEPMIGLSPEVKSDKHKLRKSKTKESTVGLTPRANVDIMQSVTPRVAKPVLGGGTPGTPTVTWTVTPSRGLKIKICRVMTPLQEKPVEDNGSYGALALYEQHVLGATPSTGKHKHKKHKLDKVHRRRKLDL